MIYIVYSFLYIFCLTGQFFSTFEMLHVKNVACEKVIICLLIIFFCL